VLCFDCPKVPSKALQCQLIRNSDARSISHKSCKAICTEFHTCMRRNVVKTLIAIEVKSKYSVTRLAYHHLKAYGFEPRKLSAGWPSQRRCTCENATPNLVDTLGSLLPYVRVSSSELWVSSTRECNKKTHLIRPVWLRWRQGTWNSNPKSEVGLDQEEHPKTRNSANQ
jgi:hypothetical protein